MKKYTTFLWRSLLCLMLGAGFSSCQAYLDKAPEADIQIDGAFVDFFNFQGYVEQIYRWIPNKTNMTYNTSWNWGDDEIFNTNSKANGMFTYALDRGNMRTWPTVGGGFGIYLSGEGGNAGIWLYSWQAIRKANMGLKALEEGKMMGTQEEKDLIAGQLYFFRAWWHFELMMYLGGLPYIDEVQSATDKLTEPRLSYQETADKVAEDFRRAADLLPINWDNTAAGQAYTAGKNMLRINKIMALGYLGKNYLWAASPLMKNGAQMGAIASGKTYDYDTAYAQKAAETFGELLTLVENGETQYSMAEFNYKDIYNHIEADGVTASFSDLNYTQNQGLTKPGTTEAIFRGPHTGETYWNLGQTFGPNQGRDGSSGWQTHDNIVHQPTANAVGFYGMANGLPLKDPESGWDPEYPFRGRDPRFYHDIIFDGVRYTNGTPIDKGIGYAYSSLYTSSDEGNAANSMTDGSGYMRVQDNASVSGYLIQKIAPHTMNKTDNQNQVSMYVSYMRLADIYLMYAEACAVLGGASGKSSNFTKTAEEAFNVIRERVGAGRLAAKFAADKNRFIDEIRRERAVELMFEGFRFNDLQRWLLLTEAPYNQKMAHDFMRVEPFSWFTAGNDPRNARVANFTERVILTRPFEAKHYWFPFPDSEVYLYEEFPQNPGW